MKVAVALITDTQNRVLITQRPHHTSHGGFWEFPGGKLEINETAENALIREIREELGIEVLQYERIGEINHQYPKHYVQLIIFRVTQYSGLPSCLEGQLNMRWVEKDQINHEEFPEANRSIVDLM